MSSTATARCVWLVDTIRRYGRITRQELEQAWFRSPFSEGKPLTRRTFCNHRIAAEQLFKININCDPTSYEYYIEQDSAGSESITEWLLNSLSLNDVLIGARDISDRIFVESVPSARDYLGIIIDAMKQNRRVRFDYHPYTRSRATTGVIIEPYFLRLFKQRWYIVSRNVEENRIKTYALDRMKDVQISGETFEPVEGLDMDNYFNDSYGIVVTQSEPRKIVLRTTPRQAKYLRALPLHHSQQETISDNFSLFTYHIRLTDDLIAELLSYGPAVTVLEPPELKAMVQTSLRESLKNYENT